MADTAVLLRFNEPSDDIAPSDSAGGLADLSVPSGLTLPPVTDGSLGRSRSFDATTGLEALELAEDATLLRRSMTIEAIVQLTNAVLTDGTRTIVARGVGGSDAERQLWGLHVVTDTGAVSLQMFWEDSAAAAATVPDVAFAPPGGVVYLAAVRRWLSATEVEVEYFVNGVSIGTVTSAEGDIEDGIGGTTTVGVRGDGAGGYENHWEDTIDEIRISSRARTAEEIAQLHRRLFVYPQLGYELVRSFLPPGESYSDDPDSAIQRELRVEGDGLGRAWSYADELEEDFLPARATRSLERWEKVARLSPLSTDSFETRRARVLGHLRKIHGYTLDEITAALTGTLALDEADIELVEHSTRWADEFDATLNETRWWKFSAAGTAPATASGYLELTAAAAETLAWPDEAKYVLTALRSGEEVEVVGELLTSGFALPDNTSAVSLVLYNHRTHDALHFGIVTDGGTSKWFHDLVVDGERTRTILGSPAVPAGDLYVRIRRLPSGNVDLQFSSTGFWGDWTDVDADAPCIDDPEWAGLALQSDATLGGTTRARFGEVRVWQPHDDLVWQWYVYRDPGLSGTPDLAGAQVIVDRMKPAHTQAAVVETLALVCDDADSLTNRDPLG